MDPTSEDVRWVGAALQRGYLRKGWNRAEAARRSGVHDRVWGRTEKGARETGERYVPSAVSIVHMARAVDVDPKPLLRRLGRDPSLADAIGPRRGEQSELRGEVEEIRAAQERVEARLDRIEAILAEDRRTGGDEP